MVVVMVEHFRQPTVDRVDGREELLLQAAALLPLHRLLLDVMVAQLGHGRRVNVRGRGHDVVVVVQGRAVVVVVIVVIQAPVLPTLVAQGGRQRFGHGRTVRVGGQRLMGPGAEQCVGMREESGSGQGCAQRHRQTHEGCCGCLLVEELRRQHSHGGGREKIRVEGGIRSRGDGAQHRRTAAGTGVHRVGHWRRHGHGTVVF